MSIKAKTKRYARITLGVALIIISVISTAALIFGVAATFYILHTFERTIDVSVYDVVLQGGATKIYCYDMKDRMSMRGEAVELVDEQLEGGSCIYVNYQAVPEYLTDAFIAVEDKRFYDHAGVDWRRTGAATLCYVLKGDASFGGSTITQQLVKNVTGERQYSMDRKIQEIIWALDLETKLSKNEILELYMNVINLSHGCIGVQAAANTYFSKDVSELSLTECAAVAAIANNPSYYDPVNNPQNNRYRRNLILDQMFAQGYIDEQEYVKAYGQELELDMSWSTKKKSVNSWYTDMVIEDVIDDLGEQYGYSPHAAAVLVYSGGLRIYTAMDMDVQDTLEHYYENRSNFPDDDDSNKFQSAMIVIDQRTGDILGVAGAVGVKEANRLQNYATMTTRPSGSVIKPLSVYAPAMERGIITSASVYDDVPVEFIPEKGKYICWPQNSPAVYRGLTNISTAIKYSTNTVAVRVLEQLGVDESFDFLYDKLGIRSLIERRTIDGIGMVTDRGVAALALGQQNFGVTVREMTGAYTSLANNGIYSETRSYYKVTDSFGNILLSTEHSGERVMSEQTASIMTQMLKGVVSSGTASDITVDSWVDVAGKTGTTQDNCDKWFIGYTPFYVGGVWCGYEYPKSMDDIDGNPCVEIWDDIMHSLNQGKRAGESRFVLSEGVVKVRCCADSGKLLTEACRADARGDRGVWCYFAAGSEPSSYCECHAMVDYDVVFGGVACDDCPEICVRQIGMIRVERSFPTQVYVTDAQFVRRGDPEIYEINTDPSKPYFFDTLRRGQYCGISRCAMQYNRRCCEHVFDVHENSEVVE